MAITFPVNVSTYEYRYDGTEVYFPQVVHHHDEHVEQRINREIERATFKLIAAQKEEQGVETFDQMIGTFEIKTNERNVFSITLTNYAIHYHFAHGLTIVDALTFDIETGETWALSDLFKQGSNYEARLGAMINQQIRERDFPVLDYPVAVNPEQGYYLADKSLVIFYQLYEISPYYAGIPMFPLAIYQIDDFFDENSLLSRMMG